MNGGDAFRKKIMNIKIASDVCRGIAKGGKRCSKPRVILIELHCANSLFFGFYVGGPVLIL